MMPRLGPDDASQNWQLLERDTDGSPAAGGWGSGLFSGGSWISSRFGVVPSVAVTAQENVDHGRQKVPSGLHRYDHHETP